MFSHLQIIRRPAHERYDCRADEQLLAQAAANGPIAALWHARQGLVVPRTYLRHATFAQACATMAESGWPVSVRHSGGGIVPQGHGILNLSLCYPYAGLPMDHSETVYRLLCDVIQQALITLHIQSSPQAVEGSFCDGRYNLAIGNGEHARKIVGTAQLWRRVRSPEPNPDNTSGSTGFTQVVLAHAVLLVNVSCLELTRQINRFESLLGTGITYRADKIASLHTLRTSSWHPISSQHVPSPSQPDTSMMTMVEDALQAQLEALRQARTGNSTEEKKNRKPVTGTISAGI